ncbi:MAG: glycerol-3-phosphate 1-O-acyltransferase PlsY [Pseudomonadota bacterium]
MTLTEQPALITVAAFAFGYLIGSIPFGLILTKLAGLGDIRAIGSGNIGATNVLRTGNKPLAVATLALDIFKGWLPIAITVALIGTVAANSGADPIASQTIAAAGVGAFIGHCFPAWLGFKGGKGVATYIGVLLGWLWPAALAFCLIWLATAFLSRFSSLSALVAAACTPLVMVARAAPMPMVVASALLSALLIAKHHTNIQRLMNGQEPKIGAKT